MTENIENKDNVEVFKEVLKTKIQSNLAKVSVYKKIQKVRAELQRLNIKKTGQNKFHWTLSRLF